jgi:hypothetical protein
MPASIRSRPDQFSAVTTVWSPASEDRAMWTKRRWRIVVRRPAGSTNRSTRTSRPRRMSSSTRCSAAASAVSSTTSPSSIATCRSSQFGRLTMLSFSTTTPPTSSRSRL